MKQNYIYIIMSLSIALIVSCSSTDLQEIKQLRIETTRDILLRDTNRLEYEARNYFINGLTFQQQFRFMEAIVEYIDALRFQQTPGIYYSLAYCFASIHKYHLAMDYALKSLELDTNFQPSLELLTHLYIGEKQFSKAIISSNRLIESNPTKANRLQNARIMNSINSQKSEELYIGIIEDFNDPYIIGEFADLLAAKKRAQEAMQWRERAFNISKNNISLAEDLIAEYLTYGEKEKALQLLKEVEVNSFSTDLVVMYQLFASWIFNNLDGLETDLIKSVRDRIDGRFQFNAGLNFAAGYLSTHIGDIDKASSYFERAIALEDSEDLILQISMIYVDYKYYTKAIELLTENMNNYGEDIRFPFYLSLIYYDKGKYEVSLHYLELAELVQKENSMIFSQKGIVFDKLNQSDSSDYYYEKAIKLNSNDFVSKNNLAYSLSVRGVQLERAMQLSSEALEKDPENPAFLDTFGWIQFKMGNYEIALSFIKNAIKKGAKSAEVLEHLGDVHYHLGNIEEALKAWNKALELEPENDVIMEKINKYK